jgi:hydrogenase nickel incorporation protein HypA/HybF
MHELGITRNIVDIVSEQAGDAKVLRVLLEIGQLSMVVPDSIRFCFDIVSKDTVLEGAELQINEIAGCARCNACAHEFAIDQPFGRCRCGSTDIRCIAGEQLNIKEMEIA